MLKTANIQYLLENLLLGVWVSFKTAFNLCDIKIICLKAGLKIFMFITCGTLDQNATLRRQSVLYM